MSLSSTASRTKNRAGVETGFSSDTFSYDADMNLRPPTFRSILALAGATLILWGAKGDILDMPMMGKLDLFDMHQNAAWVLIFGAVAAVTTSWLRQRVVAWAFWVMAISSLAYLVYDLYVKVQALRLVDSLPPGTVDQIINGTVLKPGAIAVLCGLVLQGVGLSLTRKAEQQVAA